MYRIQDLFLKTILCSCQLIFSPLTTCAKSLNQILPCRINNISQYCILYRENIVIDILSEPRLKKKRKEKIDKYYFEFKYNYVCMRVCVCVSFHPVSQSSARLSAYPSICLSILPPARLSVFQCGSQTHMNIAKSIFIRLIPAFISHDSRQTGFHKASP